VTGISGLLGLNIAQQTKGQIDVSGCYFSSPVTMEGVHVSKLDITDLSAVREYLSADPPDLIIHTAGLARVAECEDAPSLARSLNVDGARNVATVASELGAKLVHISTDQLFDGSVPWRKETETVEPINIYGRTKALGEQAVKEVCPDALVVRTNIFGWGTSARTSLSDWILKGLQENIELRMFSDMYTTPILLNQLTDMILDLVEHGAIGVYNLVGSDRVSRYEFAIAMSDAFSLPRDRIRPIAKADVPFTANRPSDLSLSSQKVQHFLNVPMPTLAEGLTQLRVLGEKGWPDRVLGEKGWPEALEAAQVLQ